MPRTPIAPVNGVKITESTAFAPGVYVLPECIEIAVEWVKKEGGPDVTVIVGRDLSEAPAMDPAATAPSTP